MVERDMPGFARGRNLEKVGLKAQDTAELFFTDVRVPVTNLLGEENQGFIHLMENLPQERLVHRGRRGRGGRADRSRHAGVLQEPDRVRSPDRVFQHSRFVLAELATEVEIARVYLDKSISEHNAGRLTVTDAAMAKWWTTELQKRVVDACVQLHGGYGYMLEYPWPGPTSTPGATIYGGTTEIMKEIIGRSLGV